jgi:hypothetical protein
VQVEDLTRLPLFPSPAVAELHRLLAVLRWRLGLERLVQSAIRGTIASSFVLIVVALTIWLLADNRSSPDETWLWLAAAPLLAALGYALVRWPSLQQTALVADQRLGLDERLATAFELSQSAEGGRFDRAQVRDAVIHVSAVAPTAWFRTWLALTRRTRTEALIALVSLVVAASAIVVVPMLPRPASLATERSTDLASGAADTGLDSNAPPAATGVDQASAATTRSDATPVPADLASRVQQETAERAALDKLAQGLGSVSAGQGAADALQRGDFGSAHDQIQSLGEQADQLSDAAKQQLARGLLQAAAASQQSDRALATSEQQTAQALSRSTYNDQRQALSALADQVERSGTRSVPADQLARDQGQLQQQQQKQQQLLQQHPQVGSGEIGSAVQGEQAGAGQPGASTTDAGTTADQGAQTTSAAGGASESDNGGAQQGGAGIGTGASPDPFSNQPSRLDTSGQQVQVPTRLGNGTNVRPADGSEDQAVSNPALGGQTVTEQAQAQQTGEVNAEENLVPGEQRPVVRGYFR